MKCFQHVTWFTVVTIVTIVTVLMAMVVYLLHAMIHYFLRLYIELVNRHVNCSMPHTT